MSSIFALIVGMFGVGHLMQPTSDIRSGAAPSTFNILTESGNQIATESGSRLETENGP